MENLTLEQKIGQLFMVSFSGPVLTSDVEEHLKKNCFGNYVLFANNFTTSDNIVKLTEGLQETAKDISNTAAFISTDQEGGMVTRIYSGATHFPSAMAVAVSGLGTGVIAEMTAVELKALGINFNLAPVLDINNNRLNPVIGVRSYGEEAGIVAKHGVEYIKALQSKGVIGCAKHFPGHGDVDVDSHLDLPRSDLTTAQMQARELIPFKAAIEAGVDSIMSAHILYKTIDDLPATLSKKILTSLLRKNLGYNGLIITDCMYMDAIREHFGMEKACIMAVNAGADILCLTGDRTNQALCFKQQSLCYEAVLNAAKSGEIKPEVINRAVARILFVKEKYKVSFEVKGGPGRYEEHEALADKISKQSVTLVHDIGNLLPLTGSKNILCLSPPPVTANIADDTLVVQESLAKVLGRSLSCRAVEFSVSPDQDEIAAIINSVESVDIVVVGTYNAILHAGQKLLVEELTRARKRVIAVALRLPYDDMSLPPVGAYIRTYEYTPRSVRNAVELLTGGMDDQ